MPRYIKATDALCVLSEYYNYITDAENYRLAIAISRVPTADAVEVVRCKDCKWFNDFGCAIRIEDDSDKPKDNDFCSFGERKETEDAKIH